MCKYQPFNIEPRPTRRLIPAHATPAHHRTPRRAARDNAHHHHHWTVALAFVGDIVGEIRHTRRRARRVAQSKSTLRHHVNHRDAMRAMQAHARREQLVRDFTWKYAVRTVRD